MGTHRIAFSTLAFPDASLATAVSLGASYGYEGVELRLAGGELVDPRMPRSDRAAIKRTVDAAGLPVVAVDSSIRLTDPDPGPDLRAFLELASDWEAPLVRVFGGALAEQAPARRDGLKAAARVLEGAAQVAGRLGVSIGVETHDSFSASATAKSLCGTCWPCWRMAATRAGSVSNGRNAGIPRSGRPSLLCPSTLCCCGHGRRRDFIEAIEQGREPGATAQDGRAALEVVLAVYESARERRTVKLPGAVAWFVLSGFADEISPDPAQQLATLAAGVDHPSRAAQRLGHERG